MPRKRQHTQPDTPEAQKATPAKTPFEIANSVYKKLRGSYKREAHAVERERTKYRGEREGYLEGCSDEVLKLLALMPDSGVEAADVEVDPTEGSE